MLLYFYVRARPEGTPKGLTATGFNGENKSYVAVTSALYETTACKDIPMNDVYAAGQRRK